ncbi:MAG: FHA domain-containing protein [Myxococcales bacterium]|nr:MAG: FHA domain-containing protein [Myxococcales bacterium]
MKHVLRYKHHDIELSEGKFVIGRAAGCQLSLDDPLVSRHHAQLTVEGELVTVEDLGSRNGVKVNGELISGRYSVQDKDQLLIGGQELKYVARRENMGDTLIQPATQRVPTFGLLGILADKAFALGRADEAERLLTELLDQVLGDLEAGREVKAELFDRSAEYAMKLASATGSARWVEYLFRAFAAMRRPCPAGIVDELYSLVRRVERVSLSALRTYIEVLRENSSTLGPADRFLVSRIEGLERLVAAK